MYQVQGKGERVVAMVMKELPGKKASSEGNSLLTVTTKREQQESRPLLSPSIDDFQSESRVDGPTPRPVTSNTAVLSTALDLVDLSEPVGPGECAVPVGIGGGIRRKGSSREKRCPPGLGSRGSSIRGSPLRRKRVEDPELIQVDVEHRTPSPRTPPERCSIDSVGMSSPPMEKWEEVSLQLEGRRRRYEKRCTSHHSSSELLWSAEFKTAATSKNSFEVHSLDDMDFISSPQAEVEVSAKEIFTRHGRFASLPSECCVTRERRRTRSQVLRGNLTTEEEYVRAKAAVESDTVFWDKMQAEWEELAKRNWLEESESDAALPPAVSPNDKGYYFHSNNPYRDSPNAFSEGQERAKHGDLNTAVLLLEAAILQDPLDSEAWQVLGMTQAENENEQGAIVSLQRCLELHPNNLGALMALAVSFTNGGMEQEACEALHRWISHNARYKHLLLDSCSPLQGSSPATPRRPGPSTPVLTPTRCMTPPLAHTPPPTRTPTPPTTTTTPPTTTTHTLHSSQLLEVRNLFQEAALLNPDGVDPDLQTGLGVLFNLSSEWDKAVDAFTAALSIRPQDYLLWNRLGATLANGDRSQEAVEAYTRALELQPGFIRSRYNLGISCINLGAHREAASNFLTALKQQKHNQLDNQHDISVNIWAALRIAISMMDRPELFQAASVGDLDLLMRAFHLDDV